MLWALLKRHDFPRAGPSEHAHEVEQVDRGSTAAGQAVFKSGAARFSWTLTPEVAPSYCHSLKASQLLKLVTEYIRISNLKGCASSADPYKGF